MDAGTGRLQRGVGMNKNSNQTVSSEEYLRLDNRVTCILQQRWPANEISQWVGMLKGKQRLRHPAPPPPSPRAAGPAGNRHRGAGTVSNQNQPPHRAGADNRWPLCWPPPYRGRAHPRGHRPERNYPVRRHRPHPLYRTGQPHRPRQPGRRRTAQPIIPAGTAPGSG